MSEAYSNLYMESRKVPPRSISDLLALSEVEEEESYDDLDQLLNTTIDNNFEEDPGADATTNNDIVEMLQSVEVSTSLSTTLPLQENNIKSDFSGVVPANTSTSPPTLPDITNTGSADILMRDKPEFLASSPIQSLHNDISDSTVPRSSISPTTLLNSLLSQSDIVLDDGISERDDKSSSILDHISSFSMDDTTFLNANMEISKSIEISNDNIDASFLGDKQEEEIEANRGKIMNNSSDDDDDDDGMNSFVTAREDGDATSTVNSKESTALIDNKSSSDEVIRNDSKDIDIELLQKTAELETDDTDTVMDRQISGSVSFHQSTGTKYEVSSAPLWDDDDPSTPKRSGREFVVPMMIDDTHANDNDTTTTISKNIVAAAHQNPNTDVIIANTNVTENIVSNVMGNIGSTCDKDANVDLDSTIAAQDTDELAEVSNPVVTPQALTIALLSVPSLSEVNSIGSQGSHELGEDVPSTGDAKDIEIEDAVYGIDKHDTPDYSKNSKEDETSLDNNNSETNHLAINPDKIDTNDEAVITHTDMKDDDSYPPNSGIPIDSMTEHLSTHENQNRLSTSTDPSNSFMGQKMGNELKSLQVEFPSMLHKSQKRSDVSLSSASSTISHGSFHKTHGVHPAPGPIDEQQHRRSKSNDSLPPRSPKKGSISLENQKIPSSATARMYPPNTESDENDGERVETKWMKQSRSIAFNPKRSIFADKHDANARSSSLSPPGSPPEPCYSHSEGDDGDSFHEETRTNSSSGIKIISSPGLWDMITDDESLPEKHWTDKLEYVNSEHVKSQCNDESIGESSISPSEAGASKTIQIATKPSFKSDISISSSVIKRPAVNKFLSVSQHSRGSYSSVRSNQSRKEKRPVVTPLGNRLRICNSGRTEVDASSLGRYSSYEASSPERASMLAMHCSSPDLYKLNEESQSSHQASPIKQIEINAFVQPSSEIGGTALITEAQPHDILSPESLVQKYSLLQENEALKCEVSAAMLQEKLLEFSAIRPLDLPLQSIKLPSPVNFIGALKWQQLIVNWKHSEIFRGMVSLNSYFPSFENQRKSDEELNSSRSALSGRLGTNICGCIELGSVPLEPKSRKAVTFSQVNPQSGSVAISSFLTSIKSGSFDAPNQEVRHLVSMEGSCDAALDKLYQTAQKNVAVLSSIIRDLVAFASINSSDRAKRNSITYTIDVKDRAAIERKAKVKYGGDIFQVKDILRSQITFRNDGELVCGLVRILQKEKAPTNTDSTDVERIKLIRIKNLFSCSSFNTLPKSPLPTGYRHLLLNLRLPDGLIFELQLNLLPIFQILGQKGYSLHRSLSDTDNFLDGRDLLLNTSISFDVNGLIAELIAHCSGKIHLPSFFNAAQINGGDKSSSEEKEEDTTSIHEDGITANAKAEYTSSNDVSGRAWDSVIHNESYDGTLSVVDKLCNTATTGDIFLAILQCGSNSISQNPRDFAAYWCMYSLFSYVLKLDSEQTLSSITDEKPLLLEYARRSLLQCLTISNQVVSTGMTGWFEYAPCTEIDLFTGQPFTTLQHLAYDCARDQQWLDAESVCRALVICCEQHLPLHHPTTLTSLIDLSVSSSMTGNQAFADRMLGRAAERLSKYLFEMENLYTSHLSKARSGNKQGQTLFTIEHGRNAIFELQAFASLFDIHLKREMVSLIGMDNEVVLANHCFVADTLSVLANCTAAAQFFLGSTSDESDDCSREYWSMAYRYYELCYTCSTPTKPLDDPFVIRSLFGLARCLREFSETENALKILSVCVSFNGMVEGKPNSEKSGNQPTVAVEDSKVEDYGDTKLHSALHPRFLPLSTSSNMGTGTNRISKSMSTALCLWLMSILSVDQKPDEEGRERAFGYLHAASVLLQGSLHTASDVSDDATRAMCIRFLSMIEDEAEQISEPMYE